MSLIPFFLFLFLLETDFFPHFRKACVVHADACFSTAIQFYIFRRILFLSLVFQLFNEIYLACVLSDDWKALYCCYENVLCSLCVCVCVCVCTFVWKRVLEMFCVCVANDSYKHRGWPLHIWLNWLFDCWDDISKDLGVDCFVIFFSSSPFIVDNILFLFEFGVDDWDAV